MLNFFKKIVVVILLFGGSISAQFESLHPILSSFSLHETSGQVYISCTIAAGNTCNGIEVLRSVDSIDYKVIGRVGGVCGSLTEPVSYNLSDKKPPLNKKLYYKLELGGFGFTNVKTIEVASLGTKGFSVYPNPANEKARIEFANKEVKTYELRLYNSRGEIIYSGQTMLNYFDVKTAALSSGFYSFLVFSSAEYQRFSGIIYVKH